MPYYSNFLGFYVDTHFTLMINVKWKGNYIYNCKQTKTW